MVQTAEYWIGEDLATVWQRLGRAGDRLRDALMRSGMVKVADVFLDRVVQMALTGSVSITYFYGLGRLAQVTASGAEWFLGDALASVRQIVDDGRNVVFARAYTPFGQVLSESGTSGSGYGFTGEQQNTTTGLVFLRARYLDPSTGRFLSQDPWEGSVQQPRSLHKYAYVLDNPLAYTDPRRLLKKSPTII